MYLTKVKIEGLSDIKEKSDKIRKTAEELDKEIKNLLVSLNNSGIEIVGVVSGENKSDENDIDTLKVNNFGGINNI